MARHYTLDDLDWFDLDGHREGADLQLMLGETAWNPANENILHGPCMLEYAKDLDREISVTIRGTGENVARKSRT